MLIINDDVTCPKINRTTGKVCHAYSCGNGSCADGHGVQNNEWIPLPPQVRARNMEQFIRDCAMEDGHSYREVLADMRHEGELDFDGAALIAEYEDLTVGDMEAARVRLAIRNLERGLHMSRAMDDFFS